jgi:ABC-type antimicrobial peptide transport system permease subunit
MDTPDSDPICVVNTLFAERNWPGESPIGKRIKNQRVDYYPWRRVVGVVSDAKMAGPGPARTHEGVYESYSQYVPELSNVYFFLVAEGNPMTFAPDLRSTITRIDPALNLNYVDTISEVLDRNTGGIYIIIGLFSAMSGAALFLAAIGLYGVISCSVNQRTFEFGIRMALGAISRDILRRVLRTSLIEMGGGTALGIIFGAILITGLRSSFSGGNSEPNPAWNSITSYGYPVIILLIVGVVAALGPALRAIRMSPTDALRDE